MRTLDAERKLYKLKEYLKDYFEDYYDELSDGKELKTYQVVLLGTDGDDITYKNSMIIKALSEKNVKLYSALAETWNPYLETIFGVFQVDGDHYSINEYIQIPKVLSFEGITSISLDKYIQMKKEREQPLFTETEALIFIYQLCDGLKSIHSLNMYHGDISHKNILLTEPYDLNPRFQDIPGLHHNISMKLIDFGISKQNKDSFHEVTTIEGTNGLSVSG